MLGELIKMTMGKGNPPTCCCGSCCVKNKLHKLAHLACYKTIIKHYSLWTLPNVMIMRSTVLIHLSTFNMLRPMTQKGICNRFYVCQLALYTIYQYLLRLTWDKLNNSPSHVSENYKEDFCNRHR